MKEFWLCFNYIWQLTLILYIIGHSLYKNNLLNKDSIKVLSIAITILVSLVLDGFHLITLIEISITIISLYIVNVIYCYLRTKNALFKQI